MPAIAPAFWRDTIALHFGGNGVLLIFSCEVTIKIFLASQVGSPRSRTVTTVIKGTACNHAGRVCAGFHEVVAGGRPCNIHFNIGCEAAIKRAVFYNRPGAVILLNLDGGKAMGIHTLQYVIVIFRFTPGTISPDD